MENPSECNDPFDSIKQELHSLRDELRRFIERTNQIHVNSIISDIRNEYSSILASHQVERATDCLTHGMVHDCKMHDTCFQIFLDFLSSTSKHIKNGDITEEMVQSYQNQLEDFKKKGPFETCDICFNEVFRLFDKQIDLMRSLGILDRIEGESLPPQFSTEEIVTQMIEPLASPTRFQIIQAVSSETKTFSELSQLTKLRGGNLLFHLRKLQEAGMVIQRHERGDYIITEKGFKILSAFLEAYASVQKGE